MKTSAVSSITRNGMRKASLIRQMFEKADQLKREVGANNVFDYSLGNPGVEPPQVVLDTLKSLSADPALGTHRYMHNAGFETVRDKVAKYLSRIQNLQVPLNAGNVVMTVGAGGALNVIFETTLNKKKKLLYPPLILLNMVFMLIAIEVNLK